MNPGIYNLQNHVLGDTIRSIDFEISKDLTGTTLECVFLNNNERILVPITISDASNGLFSTAEFTPTCLGDYIYDIKFTFPDGIVRTYLKGKLTIISNDPE